MVMQTILIHKYINCAITYINELYAHLRTILINKLHVHGFVGDAVCSKEYSEVIREFAYAIL